MRHRRLNKAALILLMISSLPLPASAERPEVRGGYDMHDGFFMRFSASAGYSMMRSDGNDPLQVEGLSGSFRASFGASLVPGLALHGDLGFTNGFSTGVAGDDLQVTQQDGLALRVPTLGIGLTWYTASHFYLTVSGSYAKLALANGRSSTCWIMCDAKETRHNDSDSVEAVTVRLAAGKEWRVSESWGVGLQVSVEVPFFLGAARDDSRWSQGAGVVTGFGVSATYN